MDLRVLSYTSIMKGYATRYCVLECDKFPYFIYFMAPRNNRGF